jgi:hypothetical protein
MMKTFVVSCYFVLDPYSTWYLFSCPANRRYPPGKLFAGYHLIVIFQEVSFMLPPLLGLLLECAKKTDQTVVSIALGALVHLIEVGGHQFSDGDWETLLKSIRYFLKFCHY